MRKNNMFVGGAPSQHSKRWGSPFALGVSLLLCLQLNVGTAAEDILDHKITLNISANTRLEAALIQWGVAAGMTVMVNTSTVGGQFTGEIRGTLSARAALTKLLLNSGLSFKEEGERILVVPASPVVQSMNAEPYVNGTSSDERGDIEAAVDDKHASEESLEEVVVTGSHIRGVTSVGAPLLSITRSEIDKSGYSTIQEVVATLPQNFAGLSPLGGESAGASPIANQNGNQATAIDLRGLGPQSTLTLIDGNRVAGNVQGRVVDISMIPLAMVDHIDILTGGSSAIYGADAVGGVANLVLRHSYEGAETSAFYSDNRYGGNRLEFDQIAGHQFGWGGFIFGYEFSRDTSVNLANTGLVQPVSDTGLSTLVLSEPSPDWQHSVNIAGEFNPGDSVEIHAEASYSHKELRTFTDQYYPSDDNYEYQNLFRADTSQYGATLGSRIKLAGDWSLDASGSWSALTFISDQTFVSGTPGALSSTEPPGNERSMLYSISAIADGTLVSLGSVQVKSAFGAEYRRESLSALSSTFDISDASRNVSSAFGELHIPLASTPDDKYSGYYSLEVSAAARYDRYSDFGHTFNPQFGLAWSPIKDLSLRASYAKAFRAPELYITAIPAQSILGYIPISDAANPAGVDYSTLVLSGGNHNVGPETAKTWTAGFDYRIPWESTTTTLSASYFNIDYSDRINTPLQTFPINASLYPTSVLNFHPTAAQVQTDLAEATFTGNYAPGSTWSGDPQTLLAQVPGVVVADNRYQNIASETVRGLDLALSSQVDTRFGKGDFSVNASRTFSHRLNISADSPSSSLVNQVGEPTDIKLRGSAGWSRWGAGCYVFLNYVGGYTNQFTQPASRIASWTTVDLSLQFDSSHYVSQGLWSNIKLALSGQNILNRDPPRFEESSLGLLFDPANASPFGRILSIRATKKW